jgi:hypothetical protein
MSPSSKEKSMNDTEFINMMKLLKPRDRLLSSTSDSHYELRITRMTTNGMLSAQGAISQVELKCTVIPNVVEALIETMVQALDKKEEEEEREENERIKKIVAGSFKGVKNDNNG